MLQSMLSVGRHQQGYPLEGVDVVPERPKPKNPISELIALSQQANKREEELKDKVDHWHRKYNQLYADYIALMYDDYVLRVKKYKIPHGPVKPTRCVNPALPVNKPSKVSEES